MEVTAKIMAAPLWIGIYPQPAYTTVDMVALADGTAATTLYTTVGGIVGHDSAALDLTAEVLGPATGTSRRTGGRSQT